MPPLLEVISVAQQARQLLPFLNELDFFKKKKKGQVMLMCLRRENTMDAISSSKI